VVNHEGEGKTMAETLSLKGFIIGTAIIWVPLLLLYILTPKSPRPPKSDGWYRL
jgi:hypothetical protein